MGILPTDFDGDGLPDLLLTGNLFGMELLQGPADALADLALKNMGDDDFTKNMLLKAVREFDG